MYKKLLIAMSVLALAACQKNKLVQSNPGNAISFQAVTNYAKTGTRAAEPGTAAATTDPNSAPTITNEMNSMNLKSFNVSFFGGSSYQNLEVDAPSMDNAATGANGNTTPGTTHWINKDNVTVYWPSDKKSQVSFYAYTPTSIKSMVSIQESGQTITGFTPAANAPDQIDLMVAAKKTAEISVVPMYFSHALSEVVVNARCDNPSYEVKVLGVKLVGLRAKTGTFTYPALTGPNNAITDGQTLEATTWSTTPENDNNLAYFSVGTSGNSDAITLVGKKVDSPQASDFTRVMGQATSNFFVLPQTGTGATVKTVSDKKVLQDDGAYIGLLVQILQKDGSSTDYTKQYFPPTAGKYAYSCVPLTTIKGETAKYTFVPGHKYIFNITFLKKGAGYHQPNNPDPNKDKDPNKPDHDPKEPTDDDKGTPIANNPIVFSAKVTDWVTSPDTDVINIDL